MKLPKRPATQSPSQIRCGSRSPVRLAVLGAIERTLSRFRPMMPSQLVILMAIVIVMVPAGGCDLFQVSFDRDNELDPSNPAYIPAPPGELAIRKSAVNPRNIEIQWEIQSVGHDGFLIEKSTGNDQPFEEIARLAPDLSIFVDNTRHLAPRMLYRVTSYVERDGELHRRLTDPISIGYGDFTQLIQAWLAQSTPRIYRFAIDWRDNIDIRVRNGYDIVAIRDDGHEYLIVSINPDPRYSYSIRESYEGPDADRFRYIRVDAYHLEGDEKRVYSSLLAELNILF
jgi:hypothetical protein